MRGARLALMTVPDVRSYSPMIGMMSLEAEIHCTAGLPPAYSLSRATVRRSCSGFT